MVTSRQEAGARVPGAAPRRTPLLLDGGCGMELKRRKAMGLDVAYNLTLFSTAALMETPGAVRQLHRDYIRAGCGVVTTASYATTRFYLDKVGEGHRVAELAARALQLAREAVAEEGAEGRVLVAASVPPLGESYHVAGLPEEALREQYAELLAALRGADVFLCETMGSVAEARVAAAACREAAGQGARIWVSFSPRRVRRGSERTCTVDGTPVGEAVAAAASMGAEAVLFNCATPEIIGLAVAEAASAVAALGRDLLVGGYGNCWEEMDLTTWSIEKNETGHGSCDQQSGGMVVRMDLTDELYTDRAAAWLRAGASIVGGCCGIGPETLSLMARRLSGEPLVARKALRPLRLPFQRCGCTEPSEEEACGVCCR